MLEGLSAHEERLKGREGPNTVGGEWLAPCIRKEGTVGFLSLSLEAGNVRPGPE